jgi:hypothetical protein
VQPVGASDRPALGGEGVGPWAEGLHQEAPEIIETLEPGLEAIAPLTVVFPIFVEAAHITDLLWQSLPSVQQGSALVLEDETLVNAFSSGSAPGTRYALENAVPLFAETLGQEKDPVPLTPRTLGASLRTGPWAGRPPSSVTGPAPGPPAPARSAVRGGAAPPRR